MSRPSLTPTLLLVTKLRENLARLQSLSGERWAALRAELQAILAELERASDAQLGLYLERLIEAVRKTPAADLLQALVQQIGAEFARLGGHPFFSIVRSTRTPPVPGKVPKPVVKVPPPSAQAVRAAAAALREALQADSAAEADLEARTRYVNLFFSESDGATPCSAATPLILGRVYRLHVHIGPERKGLADDDTPFPDAALQEQWDRRATVPITVLASSLDFKLVRRLETLYLPHAGLSSEVTFSATPIRAEGRGYLQIDLLYRGHLLQSKRVEALIVATADGSVPVSQRPLQRAFTTFTTGERLDTATLNGYPERVFTINVEKDERDGSIDMRFIDRTQGKEVVFYDTLLQPAALGEAIQRLRGALRMMISGRSPGGPATGYEWILQGDPARLDAWLPLLAEAGRSLYRQLLPQGPSADDAGESLRAALVPDTVIQINPVLGRVTLPWALLYERKVKYIEGRTRVCAAFAERAPACTDCPHAADPYTVCPNAFWGYRYAIEQLPCWAGGEIPHPAPLVQRIDNDRPLCLSFNVWPQFALWRQHLETLKQAGEVQVLEAQAVVELERIWQQHGAELGVVYFYVHGGLDPQLQQPYLALGDGHITSNFLEACELCWPRKPLVFLNGCATGDYGPQSYLSLLDDFRQAGACGVVGTECPVPEMFAEAYAAALFPRLFGGERLGQAMLAVRRRFLTEKLNPMGLVYALYATHEVALAKPVSRQNPGENP